MKLTQQDKINLLIIVIVGMIAGQLVTFIGDGYGIKTLTGLGIYCCGVIAGIFFNNR